MAPGEIAQGFVVPWPELRVQAIYETVEPDTFRGLTSTFDALSEGASPEAPARWTP